MKPIRRCIDTVNCILVQETMVAQIQNYLLAWNPVPMEPCLPGTQITVGMTLPKLCITDALNRDSQHSVEGPHTSEEVAQILATAKKAYPQAKIYASTFENVVSAFESCRQRMKVIDDVEAGDTWIYGMFLAFMLFLTGFVCCC